MNTDTRPETPEMIEEDATFREMEGPDEIEAPDAALAAREALRNAISAQAGDQPALLGTTADATQLLLYGLTTLINGLHKAESLEDVRGAAGPFAEVSAGFLARVEAGEVKLPFMDKGLASVVSDIEKRATAVAEVLHSTHKGD